MTDSSAGPPREGSSASSAGTANHKAMAATASLPEAVAAPIVFANHRAIRKAAAMPTGATTSTQV